MTVKTKIKEWMKRRNEIAKTNWLAIKKDPSVIYFFKHGFKEIIAAFLLIMSIAFIFNSSTSIKLIGFIFVIITAWLSRDIFKSFIYGAIILTGVVLYIAIGLAWWNNKTFFGKSITDQIMIGMFSILYFLLSLAILQSNRRSFDISRVPIISIYPELDYIVAENKSNDYKAMDVEVSITLINPIPQKPFDKFLYNLKSFYLRYSKRYEIRYKIPQILPKSDEVVSFNELIKEKLNLKNKDTTGQPMIPLYSNKEIKFRIKVRVIFKTDTGYYPEPIEESFDFICNENGCELDKKIGKVVKIM